MTRRLIPLLAALPVLAAACAKPAPVAQVPAPVAAPVPTTTEAAPDPDAERRAREAEAALRAAEEARVRAELAERIQFDFDKADLRPDTRAVLDRKLTILSRQQELQVRIEGHADDRGSDEYNVALGLRRALAAKEYLTSRGIATSRLTVMSHGEEQPLDRAHTERAWSVNRRDEFTITAGAFMAAK